MGGQLRGGRNSSQGAGEFLTGPTAGGFELLEAPGYSRAPEVVAEVALELAGNGRHGEAGEAHAPLGVVTVDRIEQADAGDLAKVDQLGSAVGIAAGYMPGQRLIGLVQAGASQGVGEFPEELGGCCVLHPGDHPLRGATGVRGNASVRSLPGSGVTRVFARVGCQP